MRTAYDFSPLYRSMIGVDRVADLIDSAMRGDGDHSYPPYDVEKTSEDGYRITLAAAGFALDELEITAQPNLLIVAGNKLHREDDKRTYLHRGLPVQSFERRFELADYVVVKSATYESGLLAIELAREIPEALKPRRIEIGAADSSAIVHRIKDRTEPRAA